MAHKYGCIPVIFESKPANTLFLLRASVVLSTNPLSGAKSVTFLPFPFPPFLPSFLLLCYNSCAEMFIDTYIIRKQTGAARSCVYKYINSMFITKILSCHKLWHSILQNKENKRQIPSSLSIDLRLRRSVCVCVGGGGGGGGWG